VKLHFITKFHREGRREPQRVIIENEFISILQYSGLINPGEVPVLNQRAP